MTDFKAIETFMWVVTLGSFRGAAQKLNTTQPAISQRIAQLEREVGVKLLQRDRRDLPDVPLESADDLAVRLDLALQDALNHTINVKIHDRSLLSTLFACDRRM